MKTTGKEGERDWMSINFADLFCVFSFPLILKVDKKKVRERETCAKPFCSQESHAKHILSLQTPSYSERQQEEGDDDVGGEEAPTSGICFSDQ